MSDGPRISGGGDTRVETTGMLRAASLLEHARADFGDLAAGVGTCLDGCPPGRRRVRLEEAAGLLRSARAESERAADGLRIAAERYGEVENTAAAAQRSAWALGGASVGWEARVLSTVFGPAGVLVVGAAVGLVAVDALALRSAARWFGTGELQPQLDPAVLDALGLALSSLDDAARGFLLTETPRDLVVDDPASPNGTESIAALLAALGCRPAGGPLSVTGGPQRRVAAPRDLAALAERLPDGSSPEGQVRVERYDGAGGRRWIVYVSGTVTFAPDGGEEPFDLSSNLLGVGDRPTDAQRAVLAAMREAGVAADEPVLLVGHSQGAITAARVAEHGGYRVGGVVELGGPTGQIVLPEDVPVLAAEHDEDLVPVLGGVAAGGAGGLRRVLVTRSLPHGGARADAPPLGAGVPAHRTEHYAETLRQAEASGDDRVAAFRGRISGFLDAGEGTEQRYRARRVLPGAAPVSPSAAPTGDAGSGQ